MRKPVIGIISPRSENNERTFLDVTRFVNNYPRRIEEAGGIPIGVFFPDNKFNKDALELCDGFVFTGGGIIESSQVSAMHYAVEKDKPFLAICLGIQTIAAYEWFKSAYGRKLDYKVIEEEFKPEFEDFFLERKAGHDNLNPFYNKDIEKSKHGIRLDEGILSKVFSSDYILMPSVHGFIVKEGIMDNLEFKVTGRSDDGVIEAVEGEGFKVGVQFHPEIERENIKLFEALVSNAKKRK